MTGLRPLRPHQTAAIDALKASLRSGHVAPMLSLPTGSGKTVISAHIVAGLRENLKRVCFCVPTIDLVDQTMDRFAENGIDRSDMGAMQGNHAWNRPHAPIQIATGQTLAKRYLPDVDAVIIDEAHRRFEIYDRWMDDARQRHAESAASGRLQRPFFVGVSATPWTKGLGKRYDDLIKVTSTAELIEGGYLSPFRVFAPSHPDLSGVRTVAGDYHEGDLADCMGKSELVADVVTTWLRLGQGQPTLCFAVNRAHAKALYERFQAAGVAAAYVDAKTPADERADIGRRLQAGDVKVVCNIGCLTTGIDWDVRCLILARPTKSESLFVQIIGRALRTASGKEIATILDHSDTHLRLGMVTDIDRDELDDGKPANKAERKARDDKMPLPKECASCGGLIPAVATECPCCGAERPKPMFVEADGDLSEYGTVGKRGDRPKSVTEAIRDQGKAAVYAQLLGFAEERGRAIGWAGHTYKDIFGTFPSGLSKRFSTDPTPLLRSWLRHRDIAFAKSRAREREAA